MKRHSSTKSDPRLKNNEKKKKNITNKYAQQDILLHNKQFQYYEIICKPAQMI